MSRRKNTGNHNTVGQQKIQAAYNAARERIPEDQREQWHADMLQNYEALNAALLALRQLDYAIEQVGQSHLPDKERIVSRMRSAVAALIGGAMSDAELSKISVLKIAAIMLMRGEIRDWRDESRANGA